MQFQLTRPRGAWRLYFYRAYGITDFNSHARVGRDLGGEDVVKALREFQLTRPRGA